MEKTKTHSSKKKKNVQKNFYRKKKYSRNSSKDFSRLILDLRLFSLLLILFLQYAS